MSNKLGIYIKEEYQKLGMNQQEYAKACGLSEGTIRNIEKGRTKSIFIDTYDALALGLNISTGKLLKDIGVISIIDEEKMNKIESIKFVDAMHPFLIKCGINLIELTTEQKFDVANEIIHYIKNITNKY